MHGRLFYSLTFFFYQKIIKIINSMKKNITRIALLSLLVAPLGFASISSAATTASWDTTGSYVITMNYQAADYLHDLTLVQDSLGNLTGNGGHPTGVHNYAWTLNSGAVTGSAIEFYADYTAPGDAIVPLTTMHASGTIALDGTMSGTWSDNYAGGDRSGTWSTASGIAIPLGTLMAEDFGVVSYDTGLGMLSGYTAGFGLVDATFANVQSVVVKLYGAGDQLLQTNTATAQVGIDITGSQISSPFDVSGTFDYSTDGYWVNVREAQYGQSVPAVKVVATVTLENGKIVTAENTLLVGDPTTIYPVTPPVVTAPTNKNQCKKGGWKLFTDLGFKNQGKCVSYVNTR